MIPQPSQPHFSDDASIPSTPHYSGNTKSNSVKASCPSLPRCLGSHIGLLEREPAGGDSLQMSPPPPGSSEPKPSFQGLLLLPRFTGPQTRVICWTKRKTHISLTARLRDRHRSMWRWPKTLQERPKEIQASLWFHVKELKENRSYHNIELSNAVQTWVGFEGDINCPIWQIQISNLSCRLNKIAFV